MSELEVPGDNPEISLEASPEGAVKPKGEALDEIRVNAKAKSVVLDKETIDYIERHPHKLRSLILRLALPAVAENVLATATQMADMIMVGRLGASAIAAVGLSNQPLFFIQGLFMGIGVGTTAIVARLYGASRKPEADHVAQQSLIFTFLLSAILCSIWYGLVPQVISFMGAKEDAIPLAISYMRTLVPGLFLLTLNIAMSSALRGAGDTRSPMIANTSINLINIFGNYVLIFGHLGLPAMGVAGAALSTTISRGIGTAILLYIMSGGRGVLQLRLSDGLKPDGPTLSRVLKVGLPTAAERVSLSLGITFYTRIVASLGTVTYAAHQIALNAEQISYMPGFGFATAATALVGQALGAGNKKMAEKSGWNAWKMSAWLSGVMGLVLLILPEKLMGLYVSDPEIIRMGALSLRIMGIAQVPMSAGFTIVGALRGAGDTRAVLKMTLISVWGVRLIGTWFAVQVLHLGLMGAWLVMALDWCTRAAVALIRWKSGHWKHRKV